ncbi:hypothetical protein J3B02_001926, partial [Coemansia erecta]
MGNCFSSNLRPSKKGKFPGKGKNLTGNETTPYSQNPASQGTQGTRKNDFAANFSATEIVNPAAIKAPKQMMLSGQGRTVGGSAPPSESTNPAEKARRAAIERQE